MATPYKDLVKGTDFVNRGFYANNSFALTTETRSGDYTFKTSVTGDARKPVSAALEPKYEWREHNLVFEGKLSTLNTLTAKATFKNVVPGLSTHIQGDRAVVVKGDTSVVTQAASAGLTYATTQAHFSTEAKVPIGGGAVSLTSAVHVRPVDNVSVGVKADYDLGGQPRFEGKLIGGNLLTEAALSVSYPEKVIGVSLWHALNARFQFAATVAIPPSAVEGRKPGPAVVNVAGNYTFDPFTSLKAKLIAGIDRSDSSAHAYRAGLAVTQRVNENITVSVGTDVNLNHAWGLGATGETSTYGVQVAFK